jgi:hypothetical protein
MEDREVEEEGQGEEEVIIVGGKKIRHTRWASIVGMHNIIESARTRSYSPFNLAKNGPIVYRGKVKLHGEFQKSYTTLFLCGIKNLFKE